MTAARIFTEASGWGRQHSPAELVSMDDELTFGPEFLAVVVRRGGRELLTDYKVMVLTVDQGVIAPRLRRNSRGFRRADARRRLKISAAGIAWPSGSVPALSWWCRYRAVAFAKDIKTSKQVAELFPESG